MKRIVTVITLVSFLLPVAAFAQTTTSDTEATSTTPGLIQQVQNLEGPEISHGSVVIDQEVRKRFSESRADVADLSLGPGMVLNKQLLELYIRKLALTEPMEQMNIGEESVHIILEGSAQLLGIIPAGLSYEVAVTFDTEVTSVSVTALDWWNFLATKQSTGGIASAIRQQLTTAEYLSRTQLKAFIMEAVIEQVTN